MSHKSVVEQISLDFDELNAAADDAVLRDSTDCGSSIRIGVHWSTWLDTKLHLVTLVLTVCND